MKRILSIISILLIAISASGMMLIGGKPVTSTPAITYDAASSATEGWDDFLKWTHTLAANSNSIVIVAAACEQNTTFTGCNWDQDGTPVPMTQLTTYSEGTVDFDMFYILVPAVTGAKSIQLSTSGDTAIFAAAISIYNADDTGAGTTNHDGSTVADATAASISDILTTGNANSWVVTGVWHKSAEAVDTDYSETERVERVTGGDVIAISTELIVAAGANTFGWSDAASTPWIQIMGEFKPK